MNRNIILFLSVRQMHWSNERAAVNAKVNPLQSQIVPSRYEATFTNVQRFEIFSRDSATETLGSAFGVVLEWLSPASF